MTNEEFEMMAYATVFMEDALSFFEKEFPSPHPESITEHLNIAKNWVSRSKVILDEHSAEHPVSYRMTIQ